MFKNIHLKILALIIAIFFWIFVVSLENNFLELPTEIPVQVFNLAPDLALSSKLPTIKLTVRAADQIAIRKLSPSDFDAYVDLRDAGAGVQNVAVSVTSRNPQINIVKVVPSNVSIELSPIRQKTVALVTDVEGSPATGFKVQSAKLSRDSVTVSGADNLLKKIDTVRAHVVLQGTESHDITKLADVSILDEEGKKIEELKVDTQDVEVSITIVEQQGAKDVGVKAKLTGAVTNGVVKKIEVDPAVISVIGSREVLSKLDLIETEPIDLAGLAESTTKKAKLVLPEGVSLTENQTAEVSVKVEIEKQ